MNKKGDWGFTIKGPTAIIGIAILLIVFGVYFFTLGGVLSKDITIHTSHFPDSTLRDLMSTQLGPEETFTTLFTKANTAHKRALTTAVCSPDQSWEECSKKVQEIDILIRETREKLPKVLGRDTDWYICKQEENACLILLESKKGIVERADSFVNRRIGRDAGILDLSNQESSVLLPLPTQKTIRLNLIFDNEEYTKQGINK